MLPTASEGPDTEGLRMHFEDNRLVPLLYGEYDRNLARIEQRLGVSLIPRGNQVEIRGTREAAGSARAVLDDLYRRAERGLPVEREDVDAAIRMVAEAPDAEPPAGRIRGDEAAIQTPRRLILPRSANQSTYVRALQQHELVFGLGPAGTGKTYLAVAVAVSMLAAGRVDRLILSRPAVEAGERLGFLPGDLKEKVDPYLRPLYDALYDMMPGSKVSRRLETGEIEIAPLAFMRGRTLSNAFVILDEAQNTTPAQMKMFLTRLGENSRMAVTGDPSQVDLPPGSTSGLEDAVGTLGAVPGVAAVRFTRADVVRHPLVAAIVEAYEGKRAAAPNEKSGGGRARAARAGGAA